MRRKVEILHPVEIPEDEVLLAPREWGVWCEVWGGVTGSREAWLKSNGARATFATREEAEAEAAGLMAKQWCESESGCDVPVHGAVVDGLLMAKRGGVAASADGWLPTALMMPSQETGEDDGDVDA